MSGTSHKTKVVNVKVAHIRPKYNNLEDWMNDPNNAYVGRRGVVFIDGQRFPKQDSIWHNPFKINKDNDRKAVIQRYETYIIDKIKRENLKNELLNLKNKNLGCWCEPEDCHADVLVKLIDLYGG